MSGRNTQVARILKIIHLLEINPQGFTAAELTTKMQDYGFEEQERTIRRDLDVVDQFFPLIPADVDGPREKRFKMDSIAKVAKNVSFSVEELIALFLSKVSMSATASKNPFRIDSLNNFIEKLFKLNKSEVAVI